MARNPTLTSRLFRRTSWHPTDEALATGFETFYDDPSEGVRMEEMLTYFYKTAPAGDLWIVTGATFAHDTEGSGLRTNLTCKVWTVDLSAGTATVTPEGGQGSVADTWLPETEFAQHYRDGCLAP